MDALIAVEPTGASDSIRLPSAVVLPIGTKSMCTSSPIAPTTTSPEFSPQRIANSTPSLPRHLRGQAGDLALELEDRQARAPRVVLVRERCAEDRQQAVAGELVDGPLERVDGARGDRQEAIEDERPSARLAATCVSAIEPTMSVYITVTCLRSPSIAGALLEDPGLERARRPQRPRARRQRRAASLAEARALRRAVSTFGAVS